MSFENIPELSSDPEIAYPLSREAATGRWFKILMSLADQATISGVRFLTSVMIVRCAGKEELGIYSISFGFLVIATCIQDTLVSAPFTLFHSREEGDNRRSYQGSILIQVIALGIVSALAFALAWGVGGRLGISAELNEALGILAIATPFVLLREFARRVELARLRITTAFCIDATSGLIQLLFLGVLIQFNLLHVVGVYLATGASCAIPAFVWLFTAYRGNKYLRHSISSEMTRHWSVGRWPFIAQVVGVLHFQGVVWIVGWQLGTATAGLFAACNYVVYIINPLALGVCNSLSPLAVLTYRQSGVARVHSLIALAMVGMGTAIAVLSIFIYWNADILLTTMYNDPAFEGHGLLMLFLGINMTLGVAHMMNDQGVWAIEYPRWLLRSTLLTVVVTLVLALPFTREWGLNGAAWSMILGRFVGLTYQSSMFFLFSNERPGQPRITKISVVTPTLNASRFLSTCLESVHRQRSSTVEVEHLILDGGSSDGTLELTAGYPVTLIPRPTSMNLVDAICLGFEKAQGDLVVFLGADDVFLPGALDVVAETFCRESRDVLFCRTRWVDGDLRSLGELAPAPPWLTASAHACLGWCYMSASSTFMTPKLYREQAGFDRSYLKSSDYEFFTRVLWLKIPVSRIQKVISMYRRHQENESCRQDESYWRDDRMVRQKFAPKNHFVQTLLGLSLKTWIYARNPFWAYHQLSRKLRSGHFRG